MRYLILCNDIDHKPTALGQPQVRIAGKRAWSICVTLTHTARQTSLTIIQPSMGYPVIMNVHSWVISVFAVYRFVYSMRAMLSAWIKAKTNKMTEALVISCWPVFVLVWPLFLVIFFALRSVVFYDMNMGSCLVRRWGIQQCKGWSNVP